MTTSRSCLAILIVVFVACNDDTSSSPTGPNDSDVRGDNAETEDEQGAVFFRELSQAMTDVFPLLLFGGGELGGKGGGRVLIEGKTMTFEAYSPNGVTSMDGLIVIEILESFWSITGTLVLGGGSEGEAVVAMTLDPSTDSPEPGGTVTIDGTEYDVAELAAANAES